ncbi:hypothetical protein MFUL124B02_11385 [Myxococcus fulvus 124B02]|nr:hypothetical protein MFUL124B02_11385 [Myxococcus fulvus 124B02]
MGALRGGVMGVLTLSTTLEADTTLPAEQQGDVPVTGTDGAVPRTDRGGILGLL